MALGVPSAFRILILLCIAFRSLATSAPVTAKFRTFPDTAKVKSASDTAKTLTSSDTTKSRTAIDSVHTTGRGDSSKTSLEFLKTTHDSMSRAASDSLKARRPVYAFHTPWADVRECKETMESAAECWRREDGLVNQEIGFPGTRSWTLSLTNWDKVPVSSSYFPFWRNSPYLTGGLPPPENYTLLKSGGDVQGLEDVWTPVSPVDTPVTRLDWTRGAFGMNVFDLRLRRMLSDRVYLGLEFYSATADTQSFDYQFNVHQPYLGGWGFLGKIYGPIDRDSASLVINGRSPSIHAVDIRPRVGVWLDTNRVLEVFLDDLRNSTNLTLPQGPVTSAAGEPQPGLADSMNALSPSSLSALGEGMIYGESHQDWSGQWEASHTSYSASENRRGDSLTGPGGEDALDADIFSVRGIMDGRGLPWRPGLRFSGRSETWQGDPVLTSYGGGSAGSVGSAGNIGNTGWTDAEDADFSLRPRLGFLTLEADAGAGRDSRLNDQVYWLPRFGAEASADLPYGFAATAGISQRDWDPDWETLYRRNPARFEYPSPNLKPRTDRGFRASASWQGKHFSASAGFDLVRKDRPWLPRVLPNPSVCGDLKDSVYAGVSTPCDSALVGDSSSARIPDSLALGQRNYDSEILNAWNLGLGFGVGNWRLDLKDRFLVTRRIEDGGLSQHRVDWSLPERVFQGRLHWKRDLVDNRLHLDLNWDWEWFSTRYGWAPDLTGQSKLIKLDEYLVLDFQAAMRIKTFTLYFRAMNFNHDRYATEPGVHPAGVNFRFGVDWILFN